MEKKLRLLFLIFSFAFLFSCKSYGVTWIVTVSDFSFNPQNLPNVHLGDTIRWQWLNGFHTTTAMDIPDAAMSWDQVMDVSNPVFRYIAAIPGIYSYKCTPHFPLMQGSFTIGAILGITTLEGEIPRAFKLNQNYPNPFNPMTNIKFQVPKSGLVKLTVYDVLGKDVEVMVNQQLSPGTYEVSFDGSNLPSGVYYYRIEASDFIETKKMVLIK